MLKQLAAVAALSFLGLVVVPAHATPASYTLTGNQLEGPLTGTIDYDPATGAVSGGTIDAWSPGGIETSVFTFASDSGNTSIFYGPSSGPFFSRFTLILDGSSSNPIVDQFSGEQGYVNFSGFNFTTGPADDVIEGQLLPAASDPNPAATPEPSSFVLLGTGILAAAGAARRRFMSA